VKLTTHLRLVQRSKNGWSCTSTPPIRLHGVVLRGSTGGTILNPSTFRLHEFPRGIPFRVGFYADDISIFLNSNIDKYITMEILDYSKLEGTKINTLKLKQRH
jgi:hypothetical protein